MQDHRIFPPELPARLRSYTFDDLRPGHGGLRVFQFHMGVRRTCALQDEGEPRFFTTVELAYNVDHHDGGASVPTRVKLAPQRCIGLTMNAALWRLQKVLHLQYGEYAARCAFLIDDALALRLADHERAQASFDVLVCNDTVRFPLAEVLHFPHASSLIEHRPRPADGFPSAPWAGAGEVQIVRASGAEAELRVADVVYKKFSWVPDDILWLLWMLDVVGVDHVVINVATRELPLELAREDIAKHEGLAERVTLVDLDFPSSNTNHSFSYLLHGLSHELHLRWQADFDFIFLIDTDEYPQLFAASNNNNSNRSLTVQQDHHQPRIDIKTFIRHNRESLNDQGQVYFGRSDR
jgi:hypothetical protein